MATTRRSEFLTIVEGAQAAADLDRYLTGKADEPETILDEGGFFAAVLREFRRLSREVKTSTAALREQANRALGAQWTSIPQGAREATISEAAGLIAGAPTAFAPGLKLVLDMEGGRVMAAANAATAAKYVSVEVAPTFALQNASAVHALTETTSLFFSPAYARQADRFEARAQRVLSRGLARGLSSRGIARDLKAEFGQSVANSAYWETVAANHVNRARSFAAMKSYATGGAIKYEVIAIMDDRTTEICQYMDGKVLSIETTLDQFDEFERSAIDIDGVRSLMPFMRQSRDSIYLPDGTLAAKMTDEGFRGRVGVATIQASGVGAPPYHHRCRSTIAPVF